MHIENNKYLKYNLIGILTLIGVVGYFYSDYTSSGGGYYYNLVFFIIVSVYIAISFLLLLLKFKLDFLGYLIVSPISVLFIDYIFEGYQMFNIYPLILFVVLLFVNLNTRLSYNSIFINNITPIFVAYLWLQLSVLLSIIKFGFVTDVSLYWLLIIFPIIVFILSLILYSFQKINIDKPYFISYVYIVFFLINILIIGRFIYFAYIFNSNLPEIFKRIFAFPSMSTSNYTIAILTILFIYIYANKEYVNLKVLRYSQIFFLISVLLSQSRGGLIATIITFTIMFFKSTISKVITKNITFNRRKFIGISFMLSISTLSMLMFWDNLFNFISNINIIQRIENLYNGYDLNAISRVGFWKMYFSDFKNGNFFEILFGKGMSGSVNQVIVRPHNLFILLLNQVGVIGVLIFIFAWIRVAMRLTKLTYVIFFLFLQSFVEPIFITVWTETLLLILIFIESQYINNKKKKDLKIKKLLQ